MAKRDCTFEGEWLPNGEPRFTMQWTDPSICPPEDATRYSRATEEVMDALVEHKSEIAADLLAMVRLDMIRDRVLERLSARASAIAGQTIAHHLASQLERHGIGTADPAADLRAAVEAETAARLAGLASDQLALMCDHERDAHLGQCLTSTRFAGDDN